MISQRCILIVVLMPVFSVCARATYELATSSAFTARSGKSLAQSPMHIVEAQTGDHGAYLIAV
jgi:hypothetical protein